MILIFEKGEGWFFLIEELVVDVKHAGFESFEVEVGGVGTVVL